MQLEVVTVESNVLVYLVQFITHESTSLSLLFTWAWIHFSNHFQHKHRIVVYATYTTSTPLFSVFSIPVSPSARMAKRDEPPHAPEHSGQLNVHRSSAVLHSKLTPATRGPQKAMEESRARCQRWSAKNLQKNLVKFPFLNGQR